MNSASVLSCAIAKNGWLSMWCTDATGASSTANDMRAAKAGTEDSAASEMVVPCGHSAVDSVVRGLSVHALAASS